MIFEIVVMCDSEILLDEKIVANNRDQALIQLGRRLEQESIFAEDVTDLHVRQFSPSSVSIGTPFTVTGVTGSTLAGTYVSNTGTTTLMNGDTLTIR